MFVELYYVRCVILGIGFYLMYVENRIKVIIKLFFF